MSVLGKCRSVPLPFLFVSCLSRFSLLYYTKWGLKIKLKKTEYLTNDPDELHIEGVKIKKIDSFCYLGSILEKKIAKGISNGRRSKEC